MEEKPSKAPGRWLHLFAAAYLVLFLVMRPDHEPMGHVRWIGFFILTQALVQVIFPRFRCSKPTNFIVATVVAIATIFISVES